MKIRVREINGKVHYFHMRNGIRYPIASQKSSKKRSYITRSEIEHEFPEFMNKIYDVLILKNYSKKSKKYIKNIYDFLWDWEFLSWKQFDSVIRTMSSYREYKDTFKNGTRISEYKDLINIERKSENSSCSFTIKSMVLPELNTDKEVDSFHSKVFGHTPVYKEEEEGYVLSYRKDGSRCFLFPEEKDVKFEDHCYDSQGLDLLHKMFKM